MKKRACRFNDRNQELKRTEKLGFAGGDHYIIDLTMGVSSSAHIEYHVRVILEKFILRSLINVSANVIDMKFLQKNLQTFWIAIDKAEQSFSKLPMEPSKRFWHRKFLGKKKPLIKLNL